MSIEVRAAQPGDASAIHHMVRELASHHGYLQFFKAEPQDFERLLSDPREISGAVIALWSGEPAGAAIWHRAFSTFAGRETVYLEDLLVLPPFRGRGIGEALLKAVARVTLARKAAMLHWLMMDWNEDARRLYTRAGAKIENGNCHCSLSGDALERLAS
jgi:diamine N-acetyltransferase